MLIARRRRGLVIAATLTAAGFVGASTDALGQQSRAVSIPIPWSHGRLLAWTDYAGLPDVTNSAAALTVYRLTYEEDCVAGRFHFSLLSLFQPSLSWVKGSALSTFDGRTKLLAHEQGHFDLSEVGARKVRRALSRLSEPCEMTSDERKALAIRGMREDTDAQARYDRDTDFGVNEKQQTRALLEIARQLKSLADFTAAAAPPETLQAGLSPLSRHPRIPECDPALLPDRAAVRRCACVPSPGSASRRCSHRGSHRDVPTFGSHRREFHRQPHHKSGA